MTAKQVFEYALIELSKVKAPSLLLEDFNYLFNKAINNYINRRYGIYDTSQLTSDDLRVLKSTAILEPTITSAYDELNKSISSNSYLSNKHNQLSKLYGNTYEVILPNDYLHLLNCICVYQVNKQYKCYNQGSMVEFPAIRLNSDLWAGIVNDYYNKPCYKRPYFFIHNVNKYEITYELDGDDMISHITPKSSEITNPYSSTDNTGTDLYISDASELASVSLKFPDTVSINLGDTSDLSESLINKSSGNRHSNSSLVRMEIRYGKDNEVFELKYVLVDYIKSPLFIRLTPELMDLTEDTSQIMEFPDYVCQEIINELVMLIMENSADQRLQSHMAVNQSVALPGQQQAAASASSAG